MEMTTKIEVGVLVVAMAVAGTAVETAALENPGEGLEMCSTLQPDVDQGKLVEWLESEGEVAEEILDEPEEHRVQVLVREVIPGEGSSDCLLYHGYRVDAEYVYPASAIKPVAAIGAFRFVNRWNARGEQPQIGLDSTLWFRRPVEFEELRGTDFRWVGGETLRHLVERTLVVSSNRAFNKLYDLVGHAPFNEWMWEAGLGSVRLQHRMFSKRTVPEQKWTFETAVEVPGEEERKEVRPIRRSPLDVPEMPVDGVEVGEAHTDFITGDDRDEPMDFSPKNYISIDDLQRMMIALYRPELSQSVDFEHLGDFRPFLTEVLGRHPETESDAERAEVVERFSPMLPGFLEVFDRSEIVYHNKAGRAYGFHVDNAHVANRETGRELFVTAAVYVNENRELNDDEYEYEEKSSPFLSDVGRSVARHLLAESK